ncbi:unnamed protein product [Cylindrotheca closterium]|uniref:DDE Tnp4 domain-containing protein n=1 Tax=Cylindrotheca closterium TaxID=2856 RepID=A0AAD2CWE5_9STRA|nr:unnamed protein product [Cylindrotheca closterium]
MRFMNVSLFFTSDEVLVRGFRTIKALPNITIDDNNKRNNERFMSFFGVSTTVISFAWAYILKSPDSGIDLKDKSEKGFQKILTACHYLWARPKNNEILATTCGYNCKRHVEGENLWKYVKALAKIKDQVIVWPETKYNNPRGQKILGTIDGVDFKTREKSTDQFNQCPKQFTYKHHHCGVKYELIVDAYTAKIVSINGPFRGGMSDKEIYQNKVKDRIPDGKFLVADRGYTNNKVPGWNDKFAFPSHTDSKWLANTKSRLRCRHEAVNGKLVQFAVLHKEFTHPHDKHVFAFEAVCVLVQLSMNFGHPIWGA